MSGRRSSGIGGGAGKSGMDAADLVDESIPASDFFHFILSKISIGRHLEESLDARRFARSNVHVFRHGNVDGVGYQRHASIFQNGVEESLIFVVLSTPPTSVNPNPRFNELNKLSKYA